MNRINLVVFSFVVALFINNSLQAQPLAVDQVPEPLLPWVDWTLYDQKNHPCPFFYASHQQRRCLWPTRLNLELNQTNGNFSINWQSYIDAWAELPGDIRHWPQNVRLDGDPALILDRGGRPVIKLAPGLHSINGEFHWDQMPESLKIPDTTGLITLTVNGQAIEFPVVGKEGRLWLQKDQLFSDKGGETGNTLEIDVFRHVLDDVPLQMLTRIELNVAGDQREILLGPSLLQGFQAIKLESELPTRLEPDGSLLVQIHPGRWSIILRALYPGPLTKIHLPTLQNPWPPNEIWVFEAKTYQRLVEIQGVTAVDPHQTNLPPNWMHLPAYKMHSTDTMEFKVIRRGDPDPVPNQLILQRNLWLDFDGKAYTINDHITGSLTQSWRLNTSPTMKLGRVTIDGKAQLITQLPDSDKEGVEVRRGALNLNADSRYVADVESINNLGWELDFQKASAVLHLPPGWRLFSARGVDNVPQTWLHQWTLLDLFMVLIAAFSISRLWNWLWGALALSTLALIWHEPGAPHYVWLNILAAVALLRVVQKGRFRSIIESYRNLGLLTLFLVVIPFFVDQVRIAIYPQLQLVSQSFRTVQAPATRNLSQASKESVTMEGLVATDEISKMAKRSMKPTPHLFKAELSGGSLPLDRLDPKAKLQTGPGLPEWKWSRFKLGWNGPVTQDQAIDLILFGPTTTAFIGFFRVFLTLMLSLLMLGVFPKWIPLRLSIPPSQSSLLLILLPLLTLVFSNAHGDIPDQALLDELKARLLAPPECLPVCAQISNLDIRVELSSMELELDIHAQENVAIPLPVQVGQWVPVHVSVDGLLAQGIYRTAKGQMRLNLTKGLHKVILYGLLPLHDRVTVPLPLKPHRVNVESNGWLVEGVHENGIPDIQLQLSRIKDQEAGNRIQSMEPSAFPSFVFVERTLQLGLDWRVKTVVRRISTSTSAVIIDIPLLEGESVISADVQIENNQVQVNILPEESIFRWESVIEKKSKLTLVAPETSAWAEVWRAEVSPIWHIESTGIPPVHNSNIKRHWVPEWRPWPGESLTLWITRPQGSEGQTLTVDYSDLLINPGKRVTAAILTIKIRSSQATQHTMTLPEGARLQSVQIDGNMQPIRQKNRLLNLPIKPTEQVIIIHWRQPNAMSAMFRTSEVDLGVASVNTNIRVELANDRWILLVGGPNLGPAVLFWGVLLVIVMISVGLGRFKLTPLKTSHWLLLLIGLSQIPVFGAMLVVGWLIAFGLREKFQPSIKAIYFNALQIGLCLLTIVALLLLFYAIDQGLLGYPKMQIAGNNSTAYSLKWYQDHSHPDLPHAWVISIPVLAYRFLMLAWSLWLAYSLVNWLQWGWSCFSSGGAVWRKLEPKSKKLKVSG